jgi:CRISPR-associated protein Cas2
MVVLILERASPSLRGEITRWMIQPRAGVFVGKVSATVRDRLWEKIEKASRGASGIMLYSSNTEQGFAVRSFGDPSRELVDFEGIILARMPQNG